MMATVPPSHNVRRTIPVIALCSEGLLHRHQLLRARLLGHGGRSTHACNEIAWGLLYTNATRICHIMSFDATRQKLAGRESDHIPRFACFILDNSENPTMW